MTDPTPLVATAIDGTVGCITMRRPRRLNALSAELVAQIIAGLQTAQEANCRAVILRAEPGVRTWSAGHDVSELPSDGSDPLRWNAPLEELLRTIRDLPQPVIAAVEGGVWGGACDLAFTCDLVVATSDATFAITPAKLGVPYNLAGLEHFLGVLPLHIVKAMFFTAAPLSARDAARYGLVNVLAEDTPDLETQSTRVAERIAVMAPLVVTAIKAEFTALTAANPMTPDTFEQLTALRRRAWRSQDYAEGLAAFREKRPAEFHGR